MDSEGDAGEMNSLAIDEAGYLHLTHFRGDGNTQNGYIRYAKSATTVEIFRYPPVSNFLTQVKIFPNPFKKELFGKIEPTRNYSLKIVIYDLRGRRMKILCPVII